jgi:hypothetical protein
VSVAIRLRVDLVRELAQSVPLRGQDELPRPGDRRLLLSLRRHTQPVDPAMMNVLGAEVNQTGHRASPAVHTALAQLLQTLRRPARPSRCTTTCAVRVSIEEGTQP